MRSLNFKEGGNYHIYGSGIGEKLFIDTEDYARFILLALHFQSPTKINNLYLPTNAFLKKGRFSVSDKKVREITRSRYVELICFCLLPNKFDLIVHNLKSQAVSVYMQRTLNAYGKYYNFKYKKVGHVFAGPYKASHMKENRLLLETSALIHKSPADIEEWQGSYAEYPWSSLKDYSLENRWGELLAPDLITKQFKNPSKYLDFIISVKP